MKMLDARQVGFLRNMKGDKRSPESFAFPACLTSLMEYIGEDVGWKQFRCTTANGHIGLPIRNTLQLSAWLLDCFGILKFVQAHLI